LEEKHVISKYISTALLATALMTGVATAQTATTTRTDADATATMHRDGEWRASKLVGVDVYNDANEKIGDINEMILDKSGKVTNVIIGVGGFLGMGEHYVAVAFDKLKWVDEPVRSAAAVTNAPGSAVRNTDGTAATTTGAATTTTTTRSTKDNWYPDHAVYNATKDQLQAMPQFKY
jgi:sporulation protein YlmC with PRC-barrel domain